MEGDGKGKRPRPEDVAPPSPVDGEGEVEEQQVERFFALLKSIREMRQRRGSGSSSSSERRKKPKVEGAAWMPTFQWEDFAGAKESANGVARVDPAASSEAGRRGKEKREEDGTSLDLRLSL